MRIALAHPYIWPEVRRGAERYVDDLAWYLSGQRHEVIVVTGTEGPSSTEVRPDGVVVHRRHHVGMVKLARVGIDRGQAFLLTALPALRAARPDVVHAMVPAASVAATVSRTPVLFTYIGHPTTAQVAALPRAERALYRAASRTATATAALSTASASACDDLFGRRPDVLPPGVRLDRFPLDPHVRTGTPRVLFSAAPSDRRKRLDLVLRAMPTVLDRRPDARLVVSGQGDAAWALDTVPAGARERVAAALDLLGPGTPDEVPRRYREATVTVLPSVDEAFGLALVESLASGTPVVTASGGGPADIVSADDVGRTFAAGSAGALAGALLAAIDLAGAATTPAACRRHAARWGWAEAVGSRHEEVYERVARSGAAGTAGRVSKRAPRSAMPRT